MGLFVAAVAGFVYGISLAWFISYMAFRPFSNLPVLGGFAVIPSGLIPQLRPMLQTHITRTISERINRPGELQKAARSHEICLMIRKNMPGHLAALAKDTKLADMLSEGVADAVNEYLRSHSGRKRPAEVMDLIPLGRKVGGTIDAIANKVWSQVEVAVKKLCSSKKFRDAIRSSLIKTAGSLDQDDNELGVMMADKVAEIWAEEVSKVDFTSLIDDKLAELSDREVEDLLFKLGSKQFFVFRLIGGLGGMFLGLAFYFLAV